MSKAEGEIQDLNAQLGEVLTSLGELSKWTPTVDTALTAITKVVGSLTSRIEALEASSGAPPEAPPREEEVRAHGHRVEPNIQGNTIRTTTVLGVPLGNGESYSTKTNFQSYGRHAGTSGAKIEDTLYDDYMRGMNGRNHVDLEGRNCDTGFNPRGHKEFRLPKVDFPKFDGEHPKVWKDRCEKYFAMFNVPPHLWAQFATIHFHGTAALWLQTFEAQHTIDNWFELCVAVEESLVNICIRTT